MNHCEQGGFFCLDSPAECCKVSAQNLEDISRAEEREWTKKNDPEGTGTKTKRKKNTTATAKKIPPAFIMGGVEVAVVFGGLTKTEGVHGEFGKLKAKGSCRGSAGRLGRSLLLQGEDLGRGLWAEWGLPSRSCRLPSLATSLGP